MAKNTKSILSQAMKTGDYVKLAIFLGLSIICWTWVWYEYQKPFDYNLVEIEVPGGNNLP